MTPTRASLGLVALVGAQFAAQTAAAQDRPEQGFHPLVGAAGVYRPEYRGAEDYEFQPLPFIGFRYGRGGVSLSMDGSDLKLDLAGSDRFDAGPVLGYRAGRDDDISNAVIHLLPTIDDAVEGGAFAAVNWQVGGGRLTTGVEVLADLGDAHGGYTVALETAWSARVSDRVSYGLGANVVWADESYMQAYFGVDGAGSAASGLAAFQPEAGVESVGLSANLRYRLTEDWGVAIFASYDRLLDEAADTPIVAQEGSENQAMVGFAVYRAF